MAHRLTTATKELESNCIYTSSLHLELLICTCVTKWKRAFRSTAAVITCPLGTDLRPPIHFTQLTKQSLDGNDILSRATQAIHNKNSVAEGFRVHLLIPRTRWLMRQVMYYEVSHHHEVSFNSMCACVQAHTYAVFNPLPVENCLRCPASFGKEYLYPSVTI